MNGPGVLDQVGFTVWMIVIVGTIALPPYGLFRLGQRLHDR